MQRGAIIGLGNVALHGHLPGWRRRRDVEIVAVTDARPEQHALVSAHAARRALVHDLRGAPGRGRRRFRRHLHAAEQSRAADPRSARARPARALREAAGQRRRRSGAAGRLAETTGRVLYTVHNWHHAPIVRRTAELIREGRDRPGQARDLAHPAHPARAAGDERSGNWRVDPAVAGGGVLSDHGWHVFYVIQRWIGEPPLSVSARLERRRHVTWDVEDTATRARDLSPTPPPRSC